MDKRLDILEHLYDADAHPDDLGRMLDEDALRAEYEALRAVKTHLDRRPAVRPAPPVLDRIVAQAAAQSAVRPARARRGAMRLVHSRVWQAMSAAAVLLIGVMLWRGLPADQAAMAPDRERPTLAEPSMRAAEDRAMKAEATEQEAEQPSAEEAAASAAYADGDLALQDLPVPPEPAETMPAPSEAPLLAFSRSRAQEAPPIALEANRLAVPITVPDAFSEADEVLEDDAVMEAVQSMKDRALAADAAGAVGAAGASRAARREAVPAALAWEDGAAVATRQLGNRIETLDRFNADLQWGEAAVPMGSFAAAFAPRFRPGER